MRALKNLSLSVLAITAAAFCFAAPASAANEIIKARCGTGNPAEHPQAKGCYKFAELVKQKSNGRIEITVYPGAQLGSDMQMQNALRGGTQEFAVPSTATLAGMVKEISVFALPFAFATEKQAEGVLDSPFGQRIMGMLADKGLIGLGYWEHGFRGITNSKHPIVKAEDISGLKIRVMQNSLYIDMFTALRANALPMPLNELYSALETRSVDGQENPPAVADIQKFYDVQKYYSDTRHSYDAQMLIASKIFWDKLSAADQALIKEAAREATLYQRQAIRELNANSRKVMAEHGMQINDVSDAERQRMREKLQPVIAKYRSVLGEDTVKEFYDVIAKTPK